MPLPIPPPEPQDDGEISIIALFIVLAALCYGGFLYFSRQPV